MGRNNSFKKAVRDAKATNDFFNQASSFASAPQPAPPPTTQPAVAKALPKPLASHYFVALDLSKATRDESLQRIYRMGEAAYLEYVDKSAADTREEFIQNFTDTYAKDIPGKADREWHVDLDIQKQVAEAIVSGEIIGLFCNGAESTGTKTKDIIVTAPPQFSEFDVIGTILDYLFLKARKLDEGNEIKKHERPHGDSCLPFLALGLIDATTLLRNSTDPNVAEYELYKAYIGKRLDRMDPKENLLILGGRKEMPEPDAALVAFGKLDVDDGDNPIAVAGKPSASTGENRTTAGNNKATDLEKWVKTGMQPTVTDDTDSADAEIPTATAKGTGKARAKECTSSIGESSGYKGKARETSPSIYDEIDEDEPLTPTICEGIDGNERLTPTICKGNKGKGKEREAPYNGESSKGKGKERETTADGEDSKGKGKERETAIDVEGSKDAAKVKAKRPLTKKAAEGRLHQHLLDLVNRDFPSAEARREAFARAHLDIMRSETLAAARGTQRLRPTATKATEEVKNVGKDDALKAAQAAGGWSGKFDIGTMPGWAGELEKMQLDALRSSVVLTAEQKKKAEEEEEAKKKAKK